MKPKLQRPDTWWARGKPGLNERGPGTVGRWQPWHLTQTGDMGLCGGRIRYQGDYTSAPLGTEGWLVRGRVCGACARIHSEEA